MLVIVSMLLQLPAGAAFCLGLLLAIGLLTRAPVLALASLGVAVWGFWVAFNFPTRVVMLPDAPARMIILTCQGTIALLLLGFIFLIAHMRKQEEGDIFA